MRHLLLLYMHVFNHPFLSLQVSLSSIPTHMCCCCSCDWELSGCFPKDFWYLWGFSSYNGELLLSFGLISFPISITNYLMQSFSNSVPETDSQNPQTSCPWLHIMCLACSDILFAKWVLCTFGDLQAFGISWRGWNRWEPVHSNTFTKSEGWDLAGIFHAGKVPEHSDVSQCSISYTLCYMVWWSRSLIQWVSSWMVDAPIPGW